MRAPLRWTLTLLLALLGAVSVSATALAAGPSLSVSPPKAHVGGHATLDFSTGDTQCDPQAGFTVKFTLDNDAIGQPAALQGNCHASEQVTIPVYTQCGPNHVFEGVLYAQNQAQGKASHTFEVTCPKPTITLVPTIAPTSATPSPTASPTASPTPSPTPSATPSPTPSPTPSATLAPVPSETPINAVSPPDFTAPGGGGSSAPWVIGGIGLGLLGLLGGLVLLRPRTGMPVAAGVAGIAVVAGAALAILGPSDATKPVILGSYLAGPGEGCAKGDVPVSGGFYDLDVPTDLLRFHPAGSSSDTGYWEVSVGGTGQGSTVCLRLGRSVVWKVRSASLDQASPKGGVSCQTPESLLGGGFALPWGIAGLSSYPQAPMRWNATGSPYTDGPAPAASVDALCAELPDGIKTYVTTASTPAAGIATAHCFAGDQVVNGGFSAAQVHGSYPVQAGWAAQLGSGGGAAYAVCVKPSRALGLRATTVAYGPTTASCPGSDTVLGGGWSSGSGYDGLQHFHPEGDGWRAEAPKGDVTAYVLCLHRFA